MATEVRMGVDVGGTNTDVAILSGRSVLGAAKVPTSADLLSTIAYASQCALQAAQIGVSPHTDTPLLAARQVADSSARDRPSGSIRSFTWHYKRPQPT